MQPPPPRYMVAWRFCAPEKFRTSNLTSTLNRSTPHCIQRRPINSAVALIWVLWAWCSAKGSTGNSSEPRRRTRSKYGSATRHAKCMQRHTRWPDRPSYVGNAWRKSSGRKSRASGQRAHLLDGYARRQQHQARQWRVIRIARYGCSGVGWQHVLRARTLSVCNARCAWLSSRRSTCACEARAAAGQVRQAGTVVVHCITLHK